MPVLVVVRHQLESIDGGDSFVGQLLPAGDCRGEEQAVGFERRMQFGEELAVAVFFGGVLGVFPVEIDAIETLLEADADG